MDMKESGIDISNSGETMEVIKIFDVEQDIMNCWNVVDDVKDAWAEHLARVRPEHAPKHWSKLCRK